MTRPRVLLVEDDAATLELFGELLRDQYAVWVARDGSQAMAVAGELDWNADAIVIDLHLGDELMRGNQFVDYYRTRAKRHAPVIVVSGSDKAYWVGQKLRAAATLTKPVDLAELRRVLNALVPASQTSHAD